MGDQQQMLAPGAIIGHYRVVRHISSGGFGNTYEVEHVSLPLRRCIKEFFMRGINQRVGDTVTVSVEENRPTFEQMRTKFLKEAQRMAQFHDPHVVPVMDFFKQNGTAYYVMELIKGKSLTEIMREQQHSFTEAEVREMLLQILSALSGVHAKGIFHLDLKPSNILRDDDGHLWLIDFGASKQMTAGESQTPSTSTGLCYTPHYAPPELILGSTKYIGPWTDLYSLGATLYNLLTTETPPDIADIEEEDVAFFNFPATISPDMRQLILWLMQPRRSDRPQSVTEVEQREKDYPVVRDDIITIRGKKAKSESKQKLKSRSYFSFSWIKKVIGIFFFLVLIFFLFNRDTDFCQLLCPDYNHPHMIDLGLPNGTKWACCNVGADNPEQYGDYFAWGETKSKSFFNWDNYQYGNLPSVVVNIGSDIAATNYDAARTIWGCGWQMPTETQWKELFYNTKKVRRTLKGVKGIEFIGSNGCSIFLPATNDKGYYWSSTLNNNLFYSSLCMNLSTRGAFWVSESRSEGLSIRPVCQNCNASFPQK